MVLACSKWFWHLLFCFLEMSFHQSQMLRTQCCVITRHVYSMTLLAIVIVIVIASRLKNTSVEKLLFRALLPELINRRFLGFCAYQILFACAVIYVSISHALVPYTLSIFILSLFCFSST